MSHITKVTLPRQADLGCLEKHRYRGHDHEPHCRGEVACFFMDLGEDISDVKK